MLVGAKATREFRQAFDSLQSQKKAIVEEKIGLLVNNRHHPSLHVHQVRRAKTSKKILECYIDDGMWQLGGHKIVDNVHLLNFATTNFMSWNVASKTPATPPVEIKQAAPAAYVPVNLFQHGEDTPEKEAELNYFTYFPSAHLRVLGVPEALIPALKDARSLEDALSLPALPEHARTNLFDLSTSPDLQTVLFDPSRLLYRTTLDRLEGYFEGKIKKLMLNLLPEQQQYVDMTGSPLFLLKGVAGSGKTTIGIYRAIQLASQGRRVLMLTFNKTLSSVTRTLIEELIGPLPNNLQVRTLHSVMASLLRRRGIHLNIPADEKTIGKYLQEALDEVRSKNTASVLDRDKKFFEEEIRRVIKGLGLISVEAYKVIKRYGRKTALSPLQREAVWQVYEAYQQKLRQAGIHDWSDMALYALRSLNEAPFDEPYDDLIVDEAQDLTPVDYRVFLRFVAQDVEPGTTSILILGDAAQTLYSRGFSWEQAGIQARGRTAILRKNHRNTRTIGEAAAALLKQNTLMNATNEYIDPEWIQREGNPPRLLRAAFNPNRKRNCIDQIDLVRKQILDLVGRQMFRLSDCVILCPTNDFCRMCKEHLIASGLRAVLDEDKEFHILEEHIKILTIHSAKGLEFPVVFLLGLTEGDLPLTYKLPTEEEEQQLEIEKQRVRCYVGMTRAADELYLVTVEGKESRFITELEEKLVSG